MKKIGILYGRERAFPEALIAKIAGMGGDVAAEPVVLGGVGVDWPRPYDLILDRISHQFGFYHAALEKFAADGALVVPSPAGVPDRFQTALVARSIGIPVPRSVVLPSRENPADITPDSLSNLMYPLDWERIFDYVGFPAVLRRLERRVDDPRFVVEGPEETFAAFGRTGSEVWMLEQHLPAGERFRSLVVGSAVRVMRDLPENPEGRFAESISGVDPAVLSAIEDGSRKLASAFGYGLVGFDFVASAGSVHLGDAPNLRPVADPDALGAEGFDWLVEATSRWLVALATGPARPQVAPSGPLAALEAAAGLASKAPARKASRKASPAHPAAVGVKAAKPKAKKPQATRKPRARKAAEKDAE